MEQTKLGLIGYGNMGAALLAGLIKAFPKMPVTVLEKDATKATQASATPGVAVVSELAELCAKSTLLILAIKPQDAPAILADLKAFRFEGALLSVIAGKTTTWITNLSGCKAVIRFMPSLASSIGEGAVGVCFSATIDAALRDFGLAAANAIGTAYEVPESLMGAITGASGSGIAYAFAFLHGIAMGGVRSGLPYPTALALAIDMTIGAAKLLKQSGTHPQAMIANVCSPAGTTIEGMNALEHGGFTALCMDAVVAAAQKSQALES